jgi:hypothetical protein
MEGIAMFSSAEIHAVPRIYTPKQVSARVLGTYPWETIQAFSHHASVKAGAATT